MSTATETAPAEAAEKFNRKAYATDLINRHRNEHNIHPTERLSAEHCDKLGATLSDAANIDQPKASAYIKNLDATLRNQSGGGASKAAVQSADVPGIASQKIPGSRETVSEYITRLRTEDAASKEDIVRALYDVYETQISEGQITVAVLNAVVTHVFKQIKSAKTEKTGGLQINDLCLTKYDELNSKYGSEATDSRNRLTGEAAEEFNTWYEQLRGGRVGNVERTGERMAEHAQWHMNRLLKAKGVLTAHVRVPKAPKEKTEAASDSAGE